MTVDELEMVEGTHSGQEQVLDELEKMMVDGTHSGQEQLRLFRSAIKSS